MTQKTQTPKKLRNLFADRETLVVFTANGNPDNALVDPTYAADSQIKNMLMKFARGELQPREPMYADVSSFGDFRETQERVLNIRREFDKLPSPIRNLCNNDPSRLPDIISDPKNKSFLTEHGLFKQAPQTEPAESSPPVAGLGVQPQIPPVKETK